jgi:hypothetical protein
LQRIGIDNPVDGQEGRVKTEPNDSLNVPNHCLQLAKAAEFIFHAATDDGVAVCVPIRASK